MFNFISKFMKKDEEKGITASEMTLPELKTLCAENGLDIKGLTTKADILKVVAKWEKKLSKELDEKLGKVTLRRHSKPQEAVELEFHEGKQVISKCEVEHNGKAYIDITTEGGVTHRVPKQ